MVLPTSIRFVQNLDRCDDTVDAVLQIIECIQHSLCISIAIRLAIRIESFIYEWNTEHLIEQLVGISQLLSLSYSVSCCC